MRRAALALLLAATALPACDEEPATPVEGEVRPLDLPSDADREAASKYADASALLDAGRDGQAEPLLRRVLELSPGHAGALRDLAGILMGRGRPGEAAALLRRLVAAVPDDASARRRLFDAVVAQHDTSAAEAVGHDWTREFPDSSDAWYALGCALHDAGKLDQAVHALKQAATLKGQRADVRSRLGLVYLAQGQLAQAEAAQRDANQRDPNYGDAWLRLGDLLARGGSSRRAETIDAWRHAVLSDPARLAALRVDLYRALVRAAREGQAAADEPETEWKSVVRAAGRDMLRWDGLGAPAPQSGDPSKEEKALRAAVIADPSDAQTRFRYAMALHRRGDLTRAAEEYAEAARSDPADARIRSALGAALLAAGDAAAAEPVLREAVRLGPTDQSAWRNLGWTLVLLRRDDDAVAALDSALRLHDGDRLARRAHGLARLHRGELDAGVAEVVASGWTVR